MGGTPGWGEAMGQGRWRCEKRGLGGGQKRAVGQGHDLGKWILYHAITLAFWKQILFLFPTISID